MTHGGPTEAPPITLLTTRCQKDPLTLVWQREEFSMNEPELILTDNPDSEARQLIDDKLGAYNAEHAGYWDPHPLAVLVRDAVNHRVVGACWVAPPWASCLSISCSSRRACAGTRLALACCASR